MMTMMTTTLTLRADQLKLYKIAKASVENELGGTISDDQFIQMMVMDAVRAQTNKLPENE